MKKIQKPFSEKRHILFEKTCVKGGCSDINGIRSCTYISKRIPR